MNALSSVRVKAAKDVGSLDREDAVRQTKGLENGYGIAVFWALMQTENRANDTM
eukprot:CAMPEP_0198314814 /NCGR_PEP_ID=MMETSP1450-20131203/5319_1 /TAXON_ID=753684 ORGANISM="Madagascaria erythrocladiodes, Strain CCMP3234" /NCGR_SAMPLE_ID=MMETSP1450 /ASSEMBLY_ACC=CAM_ASM_001115 /LENGTH=53 /DNA_ID=CAMNT_0044017895 /DNA_START=187 /DNA_END=345 /DNA_ORIENTATION=-